MRRRPLGKTGLNVSELGLGTWGLSGDGYGPVPESEQDRVIDRARALGITLFETADSYAHGSMERKLGERLKDDTRARIVTKIGTDRDAIPPKKHFDPEYLRTAVERSAERLGRDVIDVVLLHNPSEVAMQRREASALLAELKQAGKIRGWGVSAGTLEVASAAVDQGAEVVVAGVQRALPERPRRAFGGHRRGRRGGARALGARLWASVRALGAEQELYAWRPPRRALDRGRASTPDPPARRYPSIDRREHPQPARGRAAFRAPQRAGELGATRPAQYASSSTSWCARPARGRRISRTTS